MNDMKWVYFIQLSNHMHNDGNGKFRYWYDVEPYVPENNVDFTIWDELIPMLKEQKCNTLLIDIGDGVKFDSHPEISAPDAVSKEFLKKKNLKTEISYSPTTPFLSTTTVACDFH